MIYRVKVKPNSKKGPQVILEQPNTLTVYLREKPVDGEANRALIRVLANYFRVPKTMIAIKSGQSGRQKLVEIPTEQI